MKKTKLADSLALAACVLAGSVANADDESWDINTAILSYSESDRVSAIEPVISATKNYDDGRAANFKLVVDVLTGASANGAPASSSAQTFTRPSGKGTYVEGSGKTPLDDTFKDTRYALSGGYTLPLNRMSRITLGGNFSSEYDFASYGLNAIYERDLNLKNTTLSAGISVESDLIDPVGGVPTELLPMMPVGTGTNRRADDEDKTLVDLIFGVTQVIDQKTVAQMNYSFGSSSGYLTDPYKIVSIVDDVTGLPVGLAGGGYIYESRPDSRTKHGIYTAVKRQVRSDDVLSASYRFMTDDWGINSHTVDLRYRWDIGSGSQFIEPHVRFYDQSEADFYRHSLPATAAAALVAGDDISADYRLGSFSAYTIGTKYGWEPVKGHNVSLRAEYYLQYGDSSPSDAIGDQKTQDLFPDVDAVIFQVGYDFKW